MDLSAQGDALARPASFDEFFLDEHERPYRALFFVTGNRHDAEELMQDAFLKLWERWSGIDVATDFNGPSWMPSGDALLVNREN